MFYKKQLLENIKFTIKNNKYYRVYFTNPQMSKFFAKIC